MAESHFEKFKYRLLKIIDVSGFKVFDPVVRLVFGEEPKKQSVTIVKQLITPIIFVFCCIALWTFIAPRHKTNSGEVPTPDQVGYAREINQTLYTREVEKENDFELTGPEREAAITQVTAMLEAKKQESKELKQRLADIRVTAAEQHKQATAVEREEVQQELDAITAAQDARDASAVELSKKVAEGNASSDQLVDLLRQSMDLTEEEEKEVKKLKSQLKQLDDKPPAIKAAELASNAAANEVQHLSRRLEYLTKQNRANKYDAMMAKATGAREKLEKQQSAAAILKSAKFVANYERKAEKITEQDFPRGATIWHQVQRSLFTVFVGFLLAAAIAIPVGIMCGLNKVVMACLTPIISIFKPVSPVVWLLIFQIVVGAFFMPDPEDFWLFEWCENIWGIRTLDVNPALVFSACTVAMCAVWPALVNTALGVSSIEQDHLNVAKVLRLGLWSRLFKIIIPSALPLVFAGLRISLGVGWMVLIAAEALSSSEGLGKFVWDEYQNGSSHSFANIIFACFLVGIIGFILDRIMILLQRSVSFDDGAAVV